MRRIPGDRSRPAERDLDLVGIAEIAIRLDVQRATVDQWRRRGVLPEPEWDLAGGPIWRWSTIRAWAVETGRHDGVV